jgi:hypothetical protein
MFGPTVGGRSGHSLYAMSFGEISAWPTVFVTIRIMFAEQP